MRQRSGVALIVSVGILALMAMIATTFAINMQMEHKAAAAQLNYVKASLLAEAGVEKAVADIRSYVKDFSYDQVISKIEGYDPSKIAIAEDNGTYQVVIECEDDKVNINALDETDYLWIDRLAGDGGLSYSDIARIIDYRDCDGNVTTKLATKDGVKDVSGVSGNENNAKNAPYATIEELRLVLNDNAKYEKIKDFVTVSAPIIRGGLIGKYYADKVSFDKNTILNLSNYRGKVIELGAIREAEPWDSHPWKTFPGADGGSIPWEGWDEAHDAEWAGGYLTYKNGEGYGLDWFGVVFSGFIYIPENKIGQNITFTVNAKNGVKFYIDDTLVIGPSWQEDTEKQYSEKFISAGWHPIRVDYYAAGGENKLILKWNIPEASEGDGNNMKPEYLGYYPPSSTGHYSPPMAATEEAYNSGGTYKITSTGMVTTESGDLLAEKKLYALIRVFGTWTQTAKSEFYAPWFSLYNDFSDGEVLNVTWLDSCPTKEGTTPNALKLGYWENFDEDPGYTFLNLVVPWKETQWDLICAGKTGNGIKIESAAPHYQQDKNNEWYASPAGESKDIEINGYYSYCDSRTSYDLFVETWEKDDKNPEDRKAPDWCVGRLYAKKASYNKDSPDFYGEKDSKDYNTVLKHQFASRYLNPEDFLNLYLQDCDYVDKQCDYLHDKKLGIIGTGSDYEAYVDGKSKDVKSTKASAVNPGCVVLMAPNDYNPHAADKGYIPPLEETALVTYWDDIRIIPGKGYLISVPFVSAVSSSENVEWGRISWNQQEDVPNTGIDIYARAGDSLSSSDSGWTSSLSNGASLSVTGKKIQYKAELSTSALNTGDYSKSGATPVLKDVTITYLPQVEVLYCRQELE
ncbi:MAG: PA14 domain-containing protein [Candidatus Omnitrophota bacterium]